MGRNRIVGTVLFIAALVALLVGIRIMNFVPEAMQHGALRQFETIDELKEKLRLREVFVPAYYPECFLWPPTLVAGQTRPFTAVMIGFRRREGEGLCAVITQTAVPHRLEDQATAMKRVDQTLEHSIKGRPAKLEIGVCPDGSECSRLSWDDRGYHLTVLMKNKPIELIRMAESMIF